MSKILVAGGGGFIGSNLCYRLIKDGHDVICIDDFSTGHIENLSSLLNNKSFSLIEQNICTPIDCRVDEIYNLACPASPINYKKDPIGTLNTSFIGTQNLLNLAVDCKAKFLFASTSEVYGDPIEHPQKESYFGNVNTVGWRSCYDEGKRVAETLCYEYKNKYHIVTKIARLFNVYGPMMSINDGRVIPNFISQSLKNQPITIYGDGTQTRSFLYIDDLIEALLALMNTGEGVWAPINIGNPEELSINTIAEIIRKSTDSSSTITYLDRLPDDPKKRKPDIEVITQILGWSPNTSFEIGIDKTIKYFNKRYKLSGTNEKNLY